MTLFRRRSQQPDPLNPASHDSLRSYVQALVEAGLPEGQIRDLVAAERAHQEYLRAEAERAFRQAELAQRRDGTEAAVDRVLRLEGIEDELPIPQRQRPSDLMASGEWKWPY